jgi:hypothetical protein
MKIYEKRWKVEKTVLNTESMAKETTFLERVAAITRELSSPTSVKRADETLETLVNEYAAILGMREQAAARFGITTPAPTLPIAQAAPAAKPSETQIKNDVSGTITRLLDLIDRYRTDDESPLKTVRFATRRYYETLLKRLLEDHGNERLDQINAQIIKDWHKAWATGRGLSMARALITMLRMNFSFGLTRFDDPECTRLSLIMSKLEFEMPKTRKEMLSEEQADAIRVEAHNQNRASIALAQAFQFDTALSQKDTLGEWVPVSEPEHSLVINGDKKWVRGLRWEEIDADLILRHKASNGGDEIVVDLKDHRMVMEELERRGEHPPAGPIIMNEHTSLPWLPDDFRWCWRKIATAVGVPKSIRNSDSKTKNIQERYIPPQHRKAVRAAREAGAKEKRAAKDDPSATRVH